MTDNWLLVFVKAPSPGAVKTRLLPAWSPAEAAGLYQALVRDTLEAVQPLREVRVVVAYAPDAGFPDLGWLDGSLALVHQEGRTLGERLTHGFAWAFRQGARRVTALGSDAPDLSGAWVRQAFGELQHADVVVGPTRDGGYHLIGLSRPQPALFSDMPWSSPRLLARTLEQIARLGLRLRCVEPVADLDTPEDLERYLNGLTRSPSTHTARYLLGRARGRTRPAAEASGRSRRGPHPAAGPGRPGLRTEEPALRPSPGRVRPG